MGRGVVEGEGRWQSQAGRGGQPVAELHRAERIEPEVLERPRRVDSAWQDVSQDDGDASAHDVDQRGLSFARGQPGQALSQRG